MRRVVGGEPSPFAAMMERKKNRPAPLPDRHPPPPGPDKVPSLPVISPLHGSSPEQTHNPLGAHHMNEAIPQSSSMSGPVRRPGRAPMDAGLRSLNSSPGSPNNPAYIRNYRKGNDNVMFDKDGSIQMKPLANTSVSGGGSSGLDGASWVAVGSAGGGGSSSLTPASLSGAGSEQRLLPSTPPGPKESVRPVGYSVTKETTRSDLVQIVKTLQEELDNRTTSVNAIQRNFERLGLMYKENQAELEKLREELARSQEAVRAASTEGKVLHAMKEELKTALEANEKLKAAAEQHQVEMKARDQKKEMEMEALREQCAEATRTAETLAAQLHAHRYEIENMVREREKEDQENAQELLRIEEEKNLMAHRQQTALEKLLKMAIECASMARMPVSVSTAPSINQKVAEFYELILRANRNTEFHLPAPDWMSRANGHAFQLNMEAFGAVEQWVVPLTTLLNQLGEKIEFSVRTAIKLEKTWTKMTVGLLTEADAWTREFWGGTILSLQADVFHALEPHSRALVETVNHVVEKAASERKVLQEEVEALHETTGKERETIVIEYKAEMQQLKVKLDDTREKYLTLQKAMDGAQREQEELHVLLNESRKENTNLKSKEERLRKVQAEQLQAFQAASREMLANLKEEMAKQKKELDEQLAKEQREMRLQIRKTEEARDAAVQEVLAEKEAAVQPLQKKVRDQHDALVEVTIAVEHSSRRAIGFEQELERENVRSYKTEREAAEEARRLRICSEIHVDEIRGRAALELQEAVDHARMRVEARDEADLIAREAKWSVKSREFYRAQEGFRQTLSKRDREIVAMEEGHTHEIKYMEHKFKKELAQLQKVELHCTELEQEVEKLKHLLQVQHGEAYQVQRATLASIQCLLAAEESTESIYSCSLCFQLLQDPVTCVPCGHTFCELCIKKHPRNIPTKRFVPEDPAEAEKKKKEPIYCPECKSTCGVHLVVTRALVDLASKFQFKKGILRDIATNLQSSSGDWSAAPPIGNLPLLAPTSPLVRKRSLTSTTTPVEKTPKK